MLALWRGLLKPATDLGEFLSLHFLTWAGIFLMSLPTLPSILSMKDSLA